MKKRNRKDPVKHAAWLNDITENFWRRRLTEIAVSRFKWENMPETVDTRFLEKTLFDMGCAVFFVDDVIGPLCLPVRFGPDLDVYNIPYYRTAYASINYHCDLTALNSVLIWNNYIHTPTIIDMDIFIERLTALERTIDVNVAGQKTPKILRCNENERLSLNNVYLQYTGNVPVIFGSKDFDSLQTLASIDTTSPYVSDKLQTLKRQKFNEALTFLGIESNNSEKAERLITNESAANLGAVMIARAAALKPRREAAEAINRMFGLNITVDFENPLSVDMIQEGGEQNGGIHNGSENDM